MRQVVHQGCISQAREVQNKTMMKALGPSRPRPSTTSLTAVLAIWFLSLNLLKFVYIVACAIIVFRLADGKHSTAQLNHTVLIHSSQLFGCFFFQMTISNTAINICSQIFVWYISCFSFRWHLGAESLGYLTNLYLRHCLLCFAVKVLYTLSPAMEDLLFLPSSTTSCFDDWPTQGSEMITACDSHLHFPIAKGGSSCWWPQAQDFISYRACWWQGQPSADDVHQELWPIPSPPWKHNQNSSPV